ncbi:S41 family peptidase [Streptomyces albidoflavus]|uniref:S41 family peptidase n=1 Tax=Streptomyces albidoflavus TaxID=1886 RepID=UPI0026D80F99
MHTTGISARRSRRGGSLLLAAACSPPRPARETAQAGPAPRWRPRPGPVSSPPWTRWSGTPGSGTRWTGRSSAGTPSDVPGEPRAPPTRTRRSSRRSGTCATATAPSSPPRRPRGPRTGHRTTRYSPQGRRFPEGLGHLTLTPIRSDTAAVPYLRAARAAVREVDHAGACGWAVDLRTNTGRDMWSPLASAGPILGDGVVGAFVEADGTRTPWTIKSGTPRQYTDRWGSGEPPARPMPPVAVLTGSRNASAGKAVAIAFRGPRHPGLREADLRRPHRQRPLPPVRRRPGRPDHGPRGRPHGPGPPRPAPPRCGGGMVGQAQRPRSGGGHRLARGPRPLSEALTPARVTAALPPAGAPVSCRSPPSPPRGTGAGSPRRPRRPARAAP